MDNPPPNNGCPRSTEGAFRPHVLISGVLFFFVATLCLAPSFDPDVFGEAASPAPYALSAASVIIDARDRQCPDSAWALFQGTQASGQLAQKISTGNKNPRKRFSGLEFGDAFLFPTPCHGLASRIQQHVATSLALSAPSIRPSARGFIFFATPPPIES